MKREIKFRLYNDKFKIMYSPDTEIKHLWSIKQSTNGIIKPDEDEILMQYTGLQDKNGKDIYEGDILKVHQFIEILGENLGVSEGEVEYVAIVECHDVGVFLNTKKIMYDDITYSNFVVCMSAGLNEESLEIIGNIYQDDYLYDDDDAD